jgi:uroporphyrinogen decarboxylase
MTKREIIRSVLEGQKPPDVPCSLGLSVEAREKLQVNFAPVGLEDAQQCHLLKLGSDIGFFRKPAGIVDG